MNQHLPGKDVLKWRFRERGHERLRSGGRLTGRPAAFSPLLYHTKSLSVFGYLECFLFGIFLNKNYKKSGKSMAKFKNIVVTRPNFTWVVVHSHPLCGVWCSFVLVLPKELQSVWRRKEERKQWKNRTHKQEYNRQTGRERSTLLIRVETTVPSVLKKCFVFPVKY